MSLGDAGAFAFDGLLALDAFELGAHAAAGHEPDAAGHQRGGGQHCERAEPVGLPEVRQHRELQRRAGFVPDAVTVARPDMKSILTGGM